MSDTDTAPAVDYILNALDKHNDWLGYVTLMNNSPVDAELFRAAIDELLQSREIEIKVGFVRRRLI